MATTSSQQWFVVFQSFYSHKVSICHLGTITPMLLWSKHRVFIWSIACSYCCFIFGLGHCVFILCWPVSVFNSLFCRRPFFFVHVFMWKRERYFKRFQSFITTTLHWTAEKWKLAKHTAITMVRKPNQMHINWLQHARTHVHSQLGSMLFFFLLVFSSSACTAMLWTVL